MKIKYENHQISEEEMRKLENLEKRMKVTSVLSVLFIILFFVSKFIWSSDWQKILGSLAVLCILMSLAYLLEIYKTMIKKGEKNEK